MTSDTHATLAIQNGVDIKAVSNILGRYSAGFTLDTYTYVTGEIQKEAADRMGGSIAQAALRTEAAVPAGPPPCRRWSPK